MNALIRRTEELAKLRAARDSNRAEFIAVYGRRRIGKTFLIRQAYGTFAFEHTGLRKRGTAKQLEEFAAGNDDREGAQIDLVMERKDRVVNLCEVKFTEAPFEITDAYDRRLRIKRETYDADNSLLRAE